MTKTRILVAQPPEALSATTEALDGFDVVGVTTLLSAKRMMLEDGFDVFVIGIHFDDSRSLEFVQSIRRDKKHQLTPIIIIRTLPSSIAYTLKQSVNSVRALYDIFEYLECEDERQLKPLLQHWVRLAIETEHSRRYS